MLCLSVKLNVRQVTAVLLPGDKMISDPAWPELSYRSNVCADHLVGLRYITGGGGGVFVFKRGCWCSKKKEKDESRKKKQNFISQAD